MRLCPEPGCPTLVQSGRCGAHGGPRKAWTPKASTTPRLRGRANQQARERLFVATLQAGKGCALCAQPFRSLDEMIRDHIVPLAEGGQEDPSNQTNVQPLCKTCSDRKTREEARRGVKRW